MSQSNSQATAFGKIIFVPTHECVPSLPEMDLLFFLNEEEAMFPWRAVCVDLEMDACGASMDLAWESLKAALITYISMERRETGDSMIAAAKNIVETAFGESRQKRRYVGIYRQAKKEYIIQKIESRETPDPITKEIEI
jgi:hypothetical protein